MANLTEISEFIETVIRLDLNTPVVGFNGKVIGVSNEQAQAQALANRTLWLKELLDAVKKKQDETKDPEDVMREHLKATDPHPQYLTEEIAEGIFVEKSTGNKPNGYLQLDENGFFPASLAKLYEARYLIVKNIDERLNVYQAKNVTICFQLDVNKIYYLNSDADPSVEGNWQEGEQESLAPVITVFGRLGQIVAQDGDYTTDQITETDKREFATPKEKYTWTNKQDALTSGETIKTVFGQSVLGSGNIALGDAPDIGYVLSHYLAGDNGIDVVFDRGRQKIIIKDVADGSGVLPGLNVVSVDDAEANKEYPYNTSAGLNFDYTAHAAKRFTLYPARDVTVDYSDSDLTIVRSPLPTPNMMGYYPAAEGMVVELKAVSDMIEEYSSDPINLSDFPSNTTKFDITAETQMDSLISYFTSADDTDGFTAFSSRIYPGLEAWMAFKEPLTDKEREKVSNHNYWSDYQVWSTHTSEVFLGIGYTSPFRVTAYAFQEFADYYYTATSTPPTAWEFQGRKSPSDEWVTLDTQTDQTIMGDEDTWNVYKLNGPAEYQQYRLLVTNVLKSTSRASIPRFQLYNDLGVLLKDSDNKYYVINEEGLVSEAVIDDKGDFSNMQFQSTPVPVSSDALKANFPVRICTLKMGKITVTPYQNPNAIAIHDPITTVDNWSGFHRLTVELVSNEGDADRLFLALTPDGISYYVWENNVWNIINQYVDDEASAADLIDRGMTIAELSAIPDEAWAKFITLVSFPQIGLAIAGVVESVHDDILPKLVTLTFDDVYGWEKMSADKVKIILTSKYISFTPTEAGTYKFCYRFN